MVNDFRKDSLIAAPVVMNGEDVEVAHQNKILRTALGDKLTLAVYVDSVCKKAHQRAR